MLAVFHMTHQYVLASARAAEYSTEQATDILWTILSKKSEQLTQDCGWSQQKYIETLKLMARQLLVTS